MPALTPRRLTITLGLLALGGSAVVVTLAATGALAPVTAAALAAAGTVLAALGVIVIGVRRVDAKVQKVLREHRRHASTADAARPLADLAGRAETVLADVRDVVRDMQGALGQDRVETVTALAEVRRHLDRGLAELSAEVTPPIREVAATLRRVDGTVAPLPDRVTRIDGGLTALGDSVAALPERLARPVEASARRTYELVEAYVDLHGLVGPRAPLPALSGWAADPDVLRVLVAAIWRDRPELIVECGSGSSSVWLGYVAERIGTGRVVALEHDERYLALSRDLVRAHGLGDVVEIRYAPLEPWRADGHPAGRAERAEPDERAEEAQRAEWADGDRAGEFSWYATGALTGLEGIGALFVDGPPGGTGPLARYPALPVLLGRCAPGAVVVLDDAHRPDERRLSDRWLADFPELDRTAPGQRVHVFTRRPA